MKIGIIGAMQMEVDALQAAMEQPVSETVSGGGLLSLEADGSVSAVREAISGVPGVRRVTHNTGRSYTVAYDPEVDVRRGVFRALAKADCPILMMNTGGLSLEESFLSLTEGGNS